MAPTSHQDRDANATRRRLRHLRAQLCRPLSRLLKVPVIVENKPGALSTISTDAVAKASPAAHGAVLDEQPVHDDAVSPSRQLPTTPKEDLVPVTQALQGGSFIVANNAVPARNTEELVALAERQPGHVSFASYGSGSTSHLGFQLLQEAGHRGAARSLQAGRHAGCDGGQVMLGFEPPISALPNIKAGRVKALAYYRQPAQRHCPACRPLQKRHPGYDVSTWARLLGARAHARGHRRGIEPGDPRRDALAGDGAADRRCRAGADDDEFRRPRAIVECEAQTMGRLIQARASASTDDAPARLNERRSHSSSEVFTP